MVTSPPPTSASTVGITIDGRRHHVTLSEGPAGGPVTLLTVLRQVGVDVPALCHDDRLAPRGACRLCVVELAGHTQPVTACTTPVADGMVVATRSPTLEGLRRTLLGLLAEDYPAEAVATEPDHPFHALLRDIGVDGACQPGDDPEPGLVDDSHPLIHVDMSRCITCFRCVRICHEVQGQDVWEVVGRGSDTRIVPRSGSLATSGCVACGACVDTCPTDALVDRAAIAGPDADDPDTPLTWTRTTCAYCGVGCELEVGARQGQVVTARPALDAPVNRGHLCVKGRYGHDFNRSSDRLTSPLLLDRDGVLRPVSWRTAVDYVATRLGDLLAVDGPDALGVLGSARATNEDNYVTQKFARAVLRTNNVDCCARVCHAPSAAGLAEMLGTGAATSSYDDIEHARTIVVCGANATENHPIVGARIRQAVRHGANLVVIDPRRVELADEATVHLQPRPGTNVLLLNAVAAVVVEEGWVDSTFLHRRVDDVDDFTAWIRRYRRETVAAACGVDPTDIWRAASLVATEGPTVFFHGLGLTEHTQGTDGVRCLVNLALLTGNLGRRGTGVNPLRGQNNVQGAAHMGCEPHHLTGYAPLDEARARFGTVWGVEPPRRPGLDAVEMLAAAEQGKLQGLWVVGWDVLLTQPDTTATRRALAALDLLVVQDIFLNETARELAHVVLPAASSLEKDGTFMNAERRVQRVRQAVEPPGDARADWAIFQLVAQAMGAGDLFPYTSAEQVWDEVRTVWPAGAGMTYARLAQPGGLQWPCPTEDHPGTTLLHVDTFPGIGPRTRLRRIDAMPGPGNAAEPDTPHPDHDHLLVTGRCLTQFNAGTMTRRSALVQLRPTDTLEISPADAERLGIGDQQPVVVTSRHGRAVLPAEVTDRVTDGVVFATFHDPASALNHVVGPEADPVTHTPAYKVQAVSLAPAKPQGEDDEVRT